MRVISGSARGTKLKTVSGTDLVRPTADKVKEAMFNMIQFSVAQAAVLDLFCGSGALGIEALSRGAASATFVDASARSLRMTEDNLLHTHLDGKGILVRSDWEAFLRRCREQYSLILADPPYRMAEQLLPDLLHLCEPLLLPGGFLVFECSRETKGVSHTGYELHREAGYGATGVIIYQRRETA